MTHRLSNRCSEKGVRWNQIHSSSSSSFTTTERLASIRKTFFSLHFCSNFQMRASCKTWTHQSTTDADLQRTYSQVFLVRKHRWRHDAQISLPLQCLRVVAHSFLLALCGLKTHAAMNDSVSRKKRTMLVFFRRENCLQFLLWVVSYEKMVHELRRCNANCAFCYEGSWLARHLICCVDVCSLHKKQ